MTPASSSETNRTKKGSDFHMETKTNALNLDARSRSSLLGASVSSVITEKAGAFQCASLLDYSMPRVVSSSDSRLFAHLHSLYRRHRSCCSGRVRVVAV